MKLKILLITLCVIIITILLLLLNCGKVENFADEQYSSQNLIDMFNSLELAEKRCNEIEERNAMKNEKEQLKYNEATFNELEELDKKIIELKQIVTKLTQEKTKKDLESSKCRKKTDKILEKNYGHIQKLNDNGFLKKNNINFELNISDAIKQNKMNLSSDENYNSKCEKKNLKDYINIDKEDISNKCYNCDSNKLKENLPHIYKNFK